MSEIVRKINVSVFLSGLVDLVVDGSPENSKVEVRMDLTRSMASRVAGVIILEPRDKALTADCQQEVLLLAAKLLCTRAMSLSKEKSEQDLFQPKGQA